MKNFSHKITRQFGNIWHGNLTPTEILALVDAGIRPRNEHDKAVIEHAKERMKAGNSEPWNFYFAFNKKAFATLGIHSDPHNRLK